MDKPRVKPSRSDVWTSRALTGLGVTAAFVVPLVAIATWQLVSDPALATDIAVSGDPWPLVHAIADALTELRKRVLTAF